MLASLGIRGSNQRFWKLKAIHPLSSGHWNPTCSLLTSSPLPHLQTPPTPSWGSSVGQQHGHQSKPEIWGLFQPLPSPDPAKFTCQTLDKRESSFMTQPPDPSFWISFFLPWMVAIVREPVSHLQSSNPSTWRSNRIQIWPPHTPSLTFQWLPDALEMRYRCSEMMARPSSVWSPVLFLHSLLFLSSYFMLRFYCTTNPTIVCVFASLYVIPSSWNSLLTLC